MSRSLGAISASLTQADVIDYSWFVQIDIGGAVGTKRYTDRGGADTFSLNIDGGGAQTWTSTGLTVGTLDQSDQNTLSVSWISFVNVDGTWTTWMFTPGLRNAPVYIYQAWFNPPSPLGDGAFVGAIKMYEGKVDYQEIGIDAHLSLKPFATPWAREVPYIKGNNLGAGPIAPKPNTTIQLYDSIARTPSSPFTGFTKKEQAELAKWKPPDPNDPIDRHRAVRSP